MAHRDIRSSQPSARDIDAAILAALNQLGGGPVPWSKVQALIPKCGVWESGEAVVRLHDSGQINAMKVGVGIGRTILALPIRINAA